VNKLIRESLYFIYNGVRSEDLGLINVNLNSGLINEPFYGKRQVIKERIRWNPRSYLIDIEEEPLTFSVSFAFKDGFTEEQAREVARVLFLKNYAPLQFSSNLNKIYYGIFIGDAELVHNGAQEGYLELQFECNAPYAFTPVYTSSIYDYSNNSESGTEYIFTNIGDLPTKPQIIVEVVDGDSFSIVNNTNRGQKLEFTDLAKGEILTIDCEAESIESSLPGIYRYDNMSEDSEFLEMVRGNNYLLISGKVKIQWKWQSPLF